MVSQPSHSYENEEIFNSSEWIMLQSIRQEGLDLIKSALERGYTKAKLVDVFMAELESVSNIDARLAPSEAVKIIYGDQASADEFMLRLSSATKGLMDRFPDISGSSSIDGACSQPTEQKIEGFFANFEQIHSQEIFSIAYQDCQAVQFTACLLVCTTTGPIIYWPCAYLCSCSFCALDGICV